MTFINIIITFWIFSCLGWILEELAFIIEDKRLVNRGFLIGPYCPIYGFGSLIIIFITTHSQNPYLIFIISLLACSIIEYISSYILEKIYKIRLWDYENVKFNIKGRICLKNALIFGILGLLISKIIYPFIKNILINMSFKTNILLFIIVLTITLIDIIISCNMMSMLKDKLEKNIIKITKKDNTDEIKRIIHDIIKNESYLIKRIISNISLNNLIKKIKKISIRGKNG